MERREAREISERYKLYILYLEKISTRNGIGVIVDKEIKEKVVGAVIRALMMSNIRE